MAEKSRRYAGLGANHDENGALFVYGSLIDAPTRESLLGKPVATRAARLPGYQRRQSRHFYIVAKKEAVTPGMVLLGLGADDFAILDAYEEVPSLYTRERVRVLDESGAPLSCWVYLPTGWAVE